MNSNSNAYLASLANPLYQASVVPVVLDNDAYDAGDVIFTGDAIANAVPEPGGYARLISAFLYDFDDVGAALDIYLTQTSTAFGTKDSAPNISDANALAGNMQGVVLSTGTYKDLSGFKCFGWDNINRVVKAATGSTSLYVHGISSGTPTYTLAAGLKLVLGFSRI